jgi:hypothetical protein
MMINFHAVMIDECGGEFGADIRATDRMDAELRLREMYPESRVDQLESPEDTRAREARIYADVLAGVDYDDEGRPFYPHGDPDWDAEMDDECDLCGEHIDLCTCEEID